MTTNIKELRQTFNYRAMEFNSLPKEYSEYKPQIKVSMVGGQTKWLSITNEELEKIKKVLMVWK